MGRARGNVTVLITCEHARADVPAALRGLGLSPAVLRSHRSFDEGALPVARALARRCGVALHEGRWSRLVADLNRDADNPLVIARSVDGRSVPGNAGLDAADRRTRLERYWRPYRDAVERDARRAAARGRCVHLSVHSFVERLHGVERRNDVGLLYDPHRPRERTFVDRLVAAVVATGLTVRRNFPYFGDTDGLTQRLRTSLPATRYLGIEVELNQRVARTAAGRRRLIARLGPAIEAALVAV